MCEFQMDEKSELIRKLFDIQAIKFGQYTLKSGLQSPIYIDLRAIIAYPPLLEALSKLLWKAAVSQGCPYKTVCGVPYTAIPLATCISVREGLPMLLKRKEAKAYGTKKMVEGDVKEGEECLVVEDVVTTGESVLETVRSLRAEGLTVNSAVVVLDRNQGAGLNLTREGVTLHRVLVLDEPVRPCTHPTIPASPPSSHPLLLELCAIVGQKRTNLALSADVTTSSRLLELVDSVGPHVCMVKTHVDIMEDFSQDTALKLKALAAKHRFLVMEDRKFADIGLTVQRQYRNPRHHLTLGWAHLVTVHAIAGPGTIQALKEVAPVGTGCVLVVEMSTKGTLATGDYTKLAVKMAESHADFVVGVVSRHRVSNTLLQMTPGVQLTASEDTHGQQFLSPCEAFKAGADIIIVGRGIYESPSPVQAAVQYKTLSYKDLNGTSS
ncbi:hypothetical protein EMCRGX_G008995 [Ephydatia muelleri]